MNPLVLSVHSKPQKSYFWCSSLSRWCLRELFELQTHGQEPVDSLSLTPADSGFRLANEVIPQRAAGANSPLCECARVCVRARKCETTLPQVLLYSS